MLTDAQRDKHNPKVRYGYETSESENEIENEKSTVEEAMEAWKAGLNLIRAVQGMVS